MTAPRYYKWTDNRGRSCHGGRHDWTTEPTLTVAGPVVACENGVHVATAGQAVSHWLTGRCAEVVAAEELVDLGDKAVARRVTVGRWCLTPRILQLWKADCAERVLPIFERERLGDLRPREAIEATRQYACGVLSAASWDAACDAAKAAACDAACDAAKAAAYAAAWIDAGAAAYAASYGAACDAAWVDAYAASWDAACDAAKAAAYAASWDAACDAAKAAAYAAETAWQVDRLQAYLDGWLPPPAEPYRAHLEATP